ncbi:hypothetical protein [Micromonospora sp. NBC_01813]|uniref:hypothetical protein n=1 Tax=Micromonospora sp. NBC_01813 TaxID=2975988 RepID=UPI002DDA2643|nr:hypothetical protein [Micromonospora sp. NBC_01813]WSA09643.1 hypothetical protein OG958_02130 [Micromonospora sp. NBC_01813]
MATEDEARAGELMALVEAEAVPPNRPMRQAMAAAVAACVAQGLVRATGAGRIELLYLAFQLAGGAARHPGAGIVRREVGNCLPMVAEIAESGSHPERMQCIDFLSMFGRLDGYCYGRAAYLLTMIGKTGRDEAVAVAIELEDLSRSVDFPIDR